MTNKALMMPDAEIRALLAWTTGSDVDSAVIRLDCRIALGPTSRFCGDDLRNSARARLDALLNMATR
jgi:hypothetical protein